MNCTNEYDEQLKTARVNAQAIIAQSEKEAKDVVATEINRSFRRCKIN